jgi:hypothetical protein
MKVVGTSAEALTKISLPLDAMLILLAVPMALGGEIRVEILLRLGGHVVGTESDPRSDGEAGGVDACLQAFVDDQRAAEIDGDADAEQERDQGNAKKQCGAAPIVPRELPKAPSRYFVHLTPPPLRPLHSSTR